MLRVHSQRIIRQLTKLLQPSAPLDDAPLPLGVSTHIIHPEHREPAAVATSEPPRSTLVRAAVDIGVAEISADTDALDAALPSPRSPAVRRQPSKESVDFASASGAVPPPPATGRVHVIWKHELLNLTDLASGQSGIVLRGTLHGDDVVVKLPKQEQLVR